MRHCRVDVAATGTQEVQRHARALAALRLCVCHETVLLGCPALCAASPRPCWGDWRDGHRAVCPSQLLSASHGTREAACRRAALPCCTWLLAMLLRHAARALHARPCCPRTWSPTGQAERPGRREAGSLQVFLRALHGAPNRGRVVGEPGPALHSQSQFINSITSIASAFNSQHTATAPHTPAPPSRVWAPRVGTCPA